MLSFGDDTSAKGMPSDYEAEAFGLERWKKAGGFDFNVLQYGHWITDRHSGVYSHYNYRNAPLGLYKPWCMAQDRADATRTWIPGTKPKVFAGHLAANFPTSRLLGARALVTDSFSKGGKYDATGKDVSSLWAAPIEDSRQIVGMGIKAHRSAYNVLYGDGHAAVYGDPQETILWHTQGSNDGTLVGNNAYHTFHVNYFYPGRNAFGVRHSVLMSEANTTAVNNVKSTNLRIWHILDNAAGLDAPD